MVHVRVKVLMYLFSLHFFQLCCTVGGSYASVGFVLQLVSVAVSVFVVLVCKTNEKTSHVYTPSQ